MPELLPFQEVGADFLAQRQYALLADQMRLGKSAQAITAADDIIANRILVLCPAVARINWTREFSKFSIFNRPFQVISKGTDHLNKSHSAIMSYELAVRFSEGGRFDGERFDLLILDEAHFLKNHESKRTKAVFGAKGVARISQRVWELTGTPMPNNPSELWIHLKVFGLTKLTFYQFVKRYCQMIDGWREGDPLQIKGANRRHLPELQALLRPFALRRLAKDVLGKAEPILTDVVVLPGKWAVSPEEKERIKLEMGAAWEWMPAEGDPVGALEALAGSVATLRRYNGCQKIDPVADLVSIELENGDYEKVVIFCIHRDVVKGLMERLAKWNPASVTGSTVDRQAQVDKFTSDPSCKVFIGNIKAAGTAINLSVANNIYMVEQEWTPGENQQAVMRCSGITQDEPVFVRCVAIADSIDEKISGILRRKTQDIISLLDTNLVDSFVSDDNLSSF